jgi:hypothetical protein
MAHRNYDLENKFGCSVDVRNADELCTEGYDHSHQSESERLSLALAASGLAVNAC